VYQVRHRRVCDRNLRRQTEGRQLEKGRYFTRCQDEVAADLEGVQKPAYGKLSNLRSLTRTQSRPVMIRLAAF